MAVPVELVQLLGLFLETLVYGVFLTLFIAMVWSKRSAHRSVANSVGTFLLLVATAQLVLCVVRNVGGFVGNRHLPNGAALYFKNISNPLYVAGTALYAIQTFVGDAVLIWRFYVLHGSRKFLVLPLLVLLLAEAAMTIVGVYFIARSSRDASIFATTSFITTAFVSLTMANCIICTGGIALRIYLTSRGSGLQVSRSQSLSPIALAFVESGALYTAGAIAMLGAYVAGSIGYQIALQIIVPLIGITFCLIILQIRFHLDTPSALGHTTAEEKSAGIVFAIPRRAIRGEHTTTDSAESQPEMEAQTRSVAVPVGSSPTGRRASKDMN